jgi:hypothetical protein
MSRGAPTEPELSLNGGDRRNSIHATYHLGRHAGWVHHLLSVALMLPRHAARWGLAIQIVRWRAMGCYLLIGAGFSRNWGGPLSEEICVAGMGAREAINIGERSAN